MKKAGWGGARQRSQYTEALTRGHCEALLSTLNQSLRLGLPFNRMLTIHWEKLGVAPVDAFQCQSRFFKLANDWARKRGHEIAYLWIRENDFGDGSKGEHVHILLHIPEPIIGEFTRRMTRRWLLRVTGDKYRKGAAKFDTIGQRASNYLRAPDIYLQNLSKLVVGYLLKGASGDAANELGLPRCNEGGRIVGKRWGRSQNLR